uniref:methyltransferase family protein n=1 Tax=uncultured Draconibacterium sp. TaxID=1573823 RepID=UPI003216EE07
MELIRGLTLLAFVFFGFQIIYKQQKIKKKGIQVSTNEPGIKTYFISFLLLLFFVIFTTELVSQVFQNSFSLLPAFLQNAFCHSNFLTVIGAITVILSVVSMHFTLSAFKTSLRFGLNANNLGKLITTGIFSRSRNPFFISIVLQFLGITLVFPTLFFATITFLSVISIHFFILNEEKFMLQNYGDEYKKYTHQVRRYF